MLTYVYIVNVRCSLTIQYNLKYTYFPDCLGVRAHAIKEMVDKGTEIHDLNLILLEYLKCFHVK